VILIDVSEAAVDKGFATVARNLDRVVAKGKMSTADKDASLGRITRSVAHDALRPADIVIEAATENFDVKVKILKAIDPLLRPDVILASNTSSVSITKLAAATSRPDRYAAPIRNPSCMAIIELGNMVTLDG